MRTLRGRPNLLRIDDLLLRASGMMGLAWMFGTAVWLAVRAHPESSAAVEGTAWVVALAGTAPFGAFIAGRRVRRRERRAWALHKLIDDHVEIAADDLLRDSDFTTETLDRAIRDLNNAGAAFIVWDRKNGLVQDGRLRSARIVLDACDACGAGVSMKVALSEASAVRCPWCGDPIASAAHLVEEKTRLIEELDTDPETAARNPSSDFSVWLFVLLTLVFWPLGVGYALWKWHQSHAA